jgi:hypothetical protein
MFSMLYTQKREGLVDFGDVKDVVTTCNGMCIIAPSPMRFYTL